MFRSKLEEKVSDLLCSLGIDYEYEATKVDYQITHYYVPDFILPNGIALECKGYWDSIDRRKVKNVIEQNPQLDLRMVFQSPITRSLKDQRQRMPSGVIVTTLNGVRFIQYQSNGSYRERL